MIEDRDRAPDAGDLLQTVVFRPWPARRPGPPSSSRSSIRPCFVRAAPAAPAIAGRPVAEASAPALSPAAPDRRQYPSWIGAPPRFARFAAALQSAGGALGPESGLWRAEPWDDARTAPVRPPAGPAAGGFPPVHLGLAALAASGRRLRPSGFHRSALLIGAATAAALALVALFEPTGGQDRGRLGQLPAEAGDLVRAPATADRHRPAAGPLEPSLTGPLLVAQRTPDARIDLAVPGDPGPPAAPAPVGLSSLSAEVRPQIENAAGLAVDGKFAAVAVRTGALAEAAIAEDDPLYELGRRLQDKGDIAQAIEAYRMAAEANPGHAATWYDWGYLLQKQGDEAGARRKYLMTLRFAPHHAFAHYNLGYILQKHGDYAGAIEHYQAAIAANPSFFWSYYNLGYLEQKQGQYREALADYRKSIEVDPRQARSYENIATILRYHHVY